MEYNKILSTEDLNNYTNWLDEDILAGWVKCAEYVLQKHNTKNIIIRHKRLIDGKDEEFKVGIEKRDMDVSKVSNTIQEPDIVENAGIAMSLLVTQLLRPWISFSVTMRKKGYDYSYQPEDSDNEELLEVTGTEMPDEGERRLNTKIKKFKDKHPLSSGYISVSCFFDKVLIHWGHRNDT